MVTTTHISQLLSLSNLLFRSGKTSRTFGFAATRLFGGLGLRCLANFKAIARDVFLEIDPF
jgi:hypothetical protein